jgi:hypothetical protein
MRRFMRLVAVASTWVMLGPAAASSQVSTLGSITGIVKDTSGAVLPGVTVEAVSPVLIEKSRTAVTDGTGQYRIESLRPGTYTLTSTLAGFSTVKREGIELVGAFTASVNVEMKVGSVEETVTVTGASPIVDVQSAKRQQTLTADVISAIPTARVYHSIATLVTGVTLSGTQDVGGISGPATNTFTVHGGRLSEGRLQVDGLPTGGAQGGAGVSFYVADIGNAQEVTFNISGGLGESEVGGPVMNVVPRTGGNTFGGSLFANGANGSMASSNYTTALQSAGLRAPNELVKIWDINGVFGGPIVRDRLWFFGGQRYQGNRKLVAGMYYNQNVGIPTAFTYVPDLSHQAMDDGTWRSTNARLTWQATPRNKLNFFSDMQIVCVSCLYGGNATTAPEAAGSSTATPQYLHSVGWSSPVTSRLLLEAAAATYHAINGSHQRVGNPTDLTRMTEQCSAGCPANGGIAGLVYRSMNWSTNISKPVRATVSVSYVTGAHSMKFGYLLNDIHFDITAQTNNTAMAFQVNNGVPNQLTMNGGPFSAKSQVKSDSLYVQDQSTFGRLTLQGALRYDRVNSYFPDQQVGPTKFIPVPIVFPAQSGVDAYHDISPRVGATYNLFGTGKTALKLSLGKYLEAASLSGVYAGPNPTGLILTTASRAWSDGNKDFVPDCDLLNPAAQNFLASGGDSCGAVNANFGKAVFSSTYDPAARKGWGIRPSDWGLAATVQQQVLPRASIEVGYFRRWFQNFVVTDNRLQAASDYSPFSVTAPSDARLPDGGGQTVSGFYNVNPNVATLADNLVTYSNNIGANQYQYSNSVDVNVNVRPRNGLTLQGGTSTSQTVADSCEVRAKLPESAATNPYCHTATGFLTQVKGLASYTIPKVAIQVSGTFQSLPGQSLAANYTVASAVVAPSLGRPLSNGAANVTVNLIAPGTLYGDRINQFDFRVAKILRYGRTRTNIGLDLYNALNSSAVQTYNQAFIPGGAWLTPTLVLPSRFAKIGVQVDF